MYLCYIYFIIVKELAPYKISGLSIGFHELFTVLGIFLGLLLASFDVSILRWRIILGFPIAIAWLQMILLLFFKLDSPRYYYFNSLPEKVSY